jgi:2'-5' RNA ligase
MPIHTQKWTLIKLLEPMDEGTEFHHEDWPLHVTLADVFAVDWESSGLLEKLALLLAKHKPVELTADDDTSFGPPERPTQVTLLHMTLELRALHNDIIGLLISAGAVFNTPQYTKEGYIAHSTVQKHARLHKGDIVSIDNLTLVDMFPHGDGEQRKIVKTMPLSTEEKEA